MNKIYLTEDEFCRRYNISARTAQRWRLTGDGPRYTKIGPRRIGYPVSECEFWEKNRTHESRAAELAKKAA